MQYSKCRIETYKMIYFKKSENTEEWNVSSFCIISFFNDILNKSSCGEFYKFRQQRHNI